MMEAVNWDGTMVGYRISHSDWDKPTTDWDKTTIRYLAAKGGKSIEELIRGSSSMGTLMEEKGYAAVPSNVHPKPDSIMEGFHYYRGGYILKEYGSRNKGYVD